MVLKFGWFVIWNFCRVLADKLSSVDLKSMSHQQKLAFWINIYNVCMMNVCIVKHFPSSPPRFWPFILKIKAVIKVIYPCVENKRFTFPSTTGIPWAWITGNSSDGHGFYAQGMSCLKYCKCFMDAKLKHYQYHGSPVYSTLKKFKLNEDWMTRNATEPVAFFCYALHMQPFDSCMCPVWGWMMQAVINVGGHSLNALTIEHFILRLPYHSKDVSLFLIWYSLALG